MDDSIVLAENIRQQRTVKLQRTVSGEDQVTCTFKQHIDNDPGIRTVRIGAINMVAFVDRFTRF